MARAAVEQAVLDPRRQLEAGCGWPAFHSNVDGAVRAVACLAPDVEGVARELLSLLTRLSSDVGPWQDVI